MDTPLISVILATYNGSRFLTEAISSVLSQDYKNLELIIVDDASTDTRVSEIIDEFKQKDTRVISYRNEKNMERSWSKNHGVSLAKGEYIAFIDDDDIWEKTKLSRQISFMQQDREVGIIGTFAQFIDEDGVSISETNHLKTTKQDIRDNILLSNQFIQSAVLVKKSIFLEAGGFPDFNLCEDYDLWLRILLITSGVNIPESLIHYRVRTLSTTTKNLYRMKWITMKLVWKYRKNFSHSIRALLLRVITFPFNSTILLGVWNKLFRK